MRFAPSSDAPPNLPQQVGEEKMVLRKTNDAPPGLPNQSAKAQIDSLSLWERVGVRARAPRRQRRPFCSRMRETQHSP